MFTGLETCAVLQGTWTEAAKTVVSVSGLHYFNHTNFYRKIYGWDGNRKTVNSSLYWVRGSRIRKGSNVCKVTNLRVLHVDISGGL
jgi:hypothetical protein